MFEKLRLECTSEKKDENSGSGKGKREENIIWLKGAKMALSLYIKRWLSKEEIVRAFREEEGDDKEKEFMKMMFRSDARALQEMSPVEFGFQISGMSVSGERERKREEKGRKKRRSD